MGVHRYPVDNFPIYDEEECIGSFYQNAYEIREHEYGPRPPDILPPPAWQLMHEFPDDDAHEGLMNIRESNGEIEIWTSRIVFGEYPHNDMTREVVIYDEDFFETNRFYRFVGDLNIWTDRVFFHPNGTIWGRNMWKPSEGYPIDMIPILSKYNFQTNQFEFDPLAFEIPSNPR